MRLKMRQCKYYYSVATARSIPFQRLGTLVISCVAIDLVKLPVPVGFLSTVLDLQCLGNRMCQ